jgi:hypothetical protein
VIKEEGRPNLPVKNQNEVSLALLQALEEKVVDLGSLRKYSQLPSLADILDAETRANLNPKPLDIFFLRQIPNWHQFIDKLSFFPSLSESFNLKVNEQGHTIFNHSTELLQNHNLIDLKLDLERTFSVAFPEDLFIAQQNLAELFNLTRALLIVNNSLNIVCETNKEGLYANYLSSLNLQSVIDDQIKNLLHQSVLNALLELPNYDLNSVTFLTKDESSTLQLLVKQVLDILTRDNSISL